MPRIATVFTGMGLQGSSVVRALLKDGIFVPRAVTRSPDSESAKELAALGAEIVQGDFRDFSSIRKAIVGSEVVFAVSYPNVPGADEFEQGKFIVDTCKEEGVRLVVWSSTTGVSGPSGGKYEAYALDNKSAVDDYLRASGLPHTILLNGGFLENWTRPRFPDHPRVSDDRSEVTIPSRWVKGTIAVLSWTEHDLGQSGAAVLRAYAHGKVDEVNGKTFLVACARLPIEEYFKKVEAGLGRKVTVEWITHLGQPMRDAMYDMAYEFEWYKGMPVPDPGLIALGVKFGTVEEFVETVMKPHLGL
ncbi:NAD(P)-binding protein [Exidia glandulosa HHB12029]|uniref:NAD(P)-binding protein n=1 Tax=Exidia glandulosa HHB12029 TaxID=1314781 RepID=A0A165FD96_EXIGL|nr:NAD(P)-binding protein [Exidia glandulosa HHB12029]